MSKLEELEKLEKELIQPIIDLAAKIGTTPLHVAAIHHDGEIGKLLLTIGGCKVNAKDDKGRTAMHTAAMHGNIGFVNFLLENLANVNAKDKEGWTPLHFAAYYNRTEIAKLLLDYCAVYCDRTEIAELSLAYCTDINAKNDKGYTALYFATDMGYEELAKLLLEKGAEVNVKDINGGC